MGVRVWLKRSLEIITGREPRIRVQVKKKNSWYGNKYGGFYVVPEKISKDSIVYSFGIGEDVSFDLDIIKNHECHVFAYDPTPKSIEWISRQDLPGKFHFLPFGLSHQDGESVFYLPKNKAHVSGSLSLTDNIDAKEKISIPVFRLKTLMEKNSHDHINVLKMDIEGAEYEVLEDIIHSGVVVEQILVEFHHRFMHDGTSKTSSTLKLLYDNGFRVFGVSALNSEISLFNDLHVQEEGK
jgi:FkbM family methyltransferase